MSTNNRNVHPIVDSAGNVIGYSNDTLVQLQRDARKFLQDERESMRVANFGDRRPRDDYGRVIERAVEQALERTLHQQFVRAVDRLHREATQLTDIPRSLAEAIRALSPLLRERVRALESENEKSKCSTWEP